ncbi:MAG TPA: creatininase family protein [Candidatus Eisenbacteria bacterium]|nr:creatininase family protein [Candidatus Eisenbacteria bacterium]
MPFREWGAMTWEEAKSLDSARCVAILPVGAIEAHGPHLPLATDVIIAEAMARAGAERLAARGYAPLVLPSFAYTAAPFAAGFPGTLSMAPETVTRVLLDLARALAARGVAALAVANAHLDPAHLGSLAAAISAAKEGEGLPIVAPDLTRKPWAGRLGEEFMTGACHAGRYEGSVVMAARPDLVREEIRRALAPNPASLSTAIRGGLRTFEEAGGPRAYFGWPADATAAEGQATIATLGDILAEAVVEALAGGART